MDYVHVSDLAHAHVLALQYLLDGGEAVAVNLASGRGASVREVIDTVRAVTGSKIDARDSRRWPGDPPILVAEATRARELLGWSTERSDLATIITDAWRWHRNRFCGTKQ
jgi:UDP-glucose 4-epimerase